MAVSSKDLFITIASLSNQYAIMVWRFPICFFFRLFCNILFVPIFCFKIVLFSCHPVVARRILFVVLECPVLSFILSCLYIFLVSLLLPVLFLEFVCFTCVVFFSLFVPTWPSVLPSSYYFCLLSSISYQCFELNFPCRFWAFVRVVWRNTFRSTDKQIKRKWLLYIYIWSKIRWRKYFTFTKTQWNCCHIKIKLYIKTSFHIISSIKNHEITFSDWIIHA